MSEVQGGFWGRVKGLCAKRRMTMRDLSRETGIPYPTLANQQAAGSIPTKTVMVITLADYFGVSLDWLVKGAGTEDDGMLEDYRKLGEKERKAVRSLVEALR